MKISIALLALSILLMPSWAIAEEPLLPDISIQELLLVPRENDLPWIELHNHSSSLINLESWALENKQEEIHPLDYVISPNQFLVIPLEEGFLSTDDRVSLLSPKGEIIDSWEFTLEEQENSIHQSLILEENILITTTTPTAGRPNLASTELACSQEEEQEHEEEEQADETTTEEDNPPKQPLESGAIILNEVFANPLGDEKEEEFIELFNTENRSINLEEWILADASKSYTLPPVIIQPHGFLLLKRTTTSIALNNGAETITLHDPFNRLVHELSYEKANEGRSWNYQAIDQWYEQEPTPGQVNAEPEIEETEQEESEPEEEQPEEPDASEEGSSEEEQTETDDERHPDPNLDQVQLNELLPNPEGSDSAEWIELHNPSEEAITLTGLELQDLSKSFFFESGVIGAGEYYLVMRTESGIALNNTNETISLLIGEEIIDTVSYESSKEGMSWSRFDDEWKETSIPTPEEGNTDEVFQEEEEKPSSQAASTPKKTSTTKKDSSLLIDFAQWNTIDDGEVITMEGVLTVEPGIFQKRIAILQSMSLPNPIGVQLYFHKAEWPELSTGDVLSVTGEKSITTTGQRLLIKDGESIRVNGHADIEPISFSDANEFVFASLNGVILEQSKKELVVDYNGDEFLLPAPPNLPSFEEDSTIEVRGIVEIKQGQRLLRPRSETDLIAHEKESALAITTSIEPPSLTNTVEPSPLLWVGFGGTITAGGLLGGIYRKQLLNYLSQLVKKKDLSENA